MPKSLAVLGAVALALGCGQTSNRTLDLATTTSVQNSGLLAHLLPIFEQASGLTVRVHAAGSGRALQMLADGVVDGVISHAPETERRRLPQHPDWTYRKIAHNWFVVAGPAADPAGVSGAPDAVAAFQQIADSGSRFVSRGDESGTHERERSLWTAAGRQPSPPDLIVSGRGMAQALRHASEARAYVLTDASTFWQLASRLELQILFDHDRRLINTYAVIHPGSGPKAATLATWLSSVEGANAIAAFLIDGKRAFEPWPVGCPARQPSDLPCS
ncbi:MAG: substrate-binding domain-containing protein [Acidobacteriota bacterium]|nr:substrate-binding domain-containing protein [Acidobacteriota bacterium]